jgi:hypothetical protein
LRSASLSGTTGFCSHITSGRSNLVVPPPAFMPSIGLR